MWGPAQEGFRLTNPVGSFAGSQGPGTHQPALFENKPQTEAIREQKIEAMARAASRTGGLEAYNAVREAHGLPRVRSAVEAHREQEAAPEISPSAPPTEADVAANEPAVAGVEIIEGHHTGWNAPAWIVRLPKGTGEFRTLAALVKAHDGYYQKAGPRFPWGFYLRSRAAAQAFAAAATNTAAPQPPAPATSGPTQLRVIRTTHYIARAGMPATGGMISGQEGQLTEIEVTDGQSVGRAFVREGTLRERGGFYMSSNERWAEKTGARSRDPQILELAVESGPWTFDEVAALVGRVDHKGRLVQRNARFTPKWAHREFDVEPGATILQQSALDTPETLRAAVNVVNGPWRSPTASPEEPPARRPSYTAKLRSLAAELRARARGEEGRERRTNTRKRAGQAAHAIDRAREDLRRADSLERIAVAVDAGEAPTLSQIAGLTHLDALDREVGAALRRQADAHDGKDRGPLDLSYVQFPRIRTTADVLRSTLREANSTKKSAPYLWQLAARTDNDWIILDERDIGELRGVVRDAGTHNTLRLNLQHHDRLRAFGVTDTDTLRAAIGQYLACCRTDRKKASPLELALRELQNATYDGYFPTPHAVAARVVELAEIPEGARVLEPSAGKGDLADAVRRAVPSATVDVVEVIPRLREVLELKGYQLVGDDFLQFRGGPYPRIVMNPPFEQGKDAAHVRHAYELLEPGGVLVSIVSEGLFFRENAAAFRSWLAEVGGTSEKLPEGSFMASDRSTGVATRIVVVHKPADCGCKHGGEGPAKEASMDSEKAWPSDPEAARLVAEAVRLGRPFPWDETPTGKLADLARRAWVEVIWKDPGPENPALQFLMASNERQAHYPSDMPWYSRADPIIFSAPTAGFKVPKSTLRDATERIEKVAIRDAKRTGKPVEELTPPPRLVAHLKVLRGLEKRRAKIKPYIYGVHGVQGTSATPAPGQKPKPLRPAPTPEPVVEPSPPAAKFNPEEGHTPESASDFAALDAITEAERVQSARPDLFVLQRVLERVDAELAKRYNQESVLSNVAAEYVDGRGEAFILRSLGWDAVPLFLERPAVVVLLGGHVVAFRDHMGGLTIHPEQRGKLNNLRADFRKAEERLLEIREVLADKGVGLYGKDGDIGTQERLERYALPMWKEARGDAAPPIASTVKPIRSELPDEKELDVVDAKVKRAAKVRTAVEQPKVSAPTPADAARKKAEARKAAEEARIARNRELAAERARATDKKAADRLAKQREKQVAAEEARRSRFREGTPVVRAEVVDPLTGERIPADLPFGTATGEMVVTVPTREGRIAVPVEPSDVDPRTRRGRLLAGRAGHYQEVAAGIADEIHRERADAASFAGGERFEDVGQAVEQYMAHNGLYHHIDAVADVAPLEEWMSRVEVRVGRAKHASPLSKSPAGRRLADAWTAGPTGGARAALRYIFGQGKGRRWDAVPWRMVDELERLLRRAAEGEARRRGTTWDLTVGWRPSTLRRGDLPSEGEYGRLSDVDRTQVTRHFHAATFAEAARRAREYLAQNKKCMDLPTQRLVKLRIATFEKWAKAPGLAPPRLCDPLPRYGAQVCEYPSITADLEQLQHVCQTGKYDPVLAHQFIQEQNWSPPADYQPDDNFVF